jgi:ectoine hydroxylase-related dioxygenase (phytanoyl-CoA dioxygenase family)
MMSIEERYEFDINGFIIYRNVLSPADLRGIRRALTRVSCAEKTGKFAFFDLDPRFAVLMARPHTIEVVRDLCGDWVRFDHAFGLEMRDDRPSGQGMHAGNRKNQGAFAYQWASGRMHNGLVKVLYSLTDVKSGDGGFVCVPGSHKANVDYKPTRESHLVINPSLKAGDMLVFTEALVHGSSPWKREKPRRVLIYSYAPGCLAWKDPSTIAHLSNFITTEAQKDLFRPPYVGNYDERILNDGSWGNTRRSPTKR